MTKRELRIVNPNTDPSVTRWLRDEARRVVGDSFEVVAVNADSGLPAIQTPAEIEFAATALLSAISAASAAGGNGPRRGRVARSERPAGRHALSSVLDRGA